MGHSKAKYNVWAEMIKFINSKPLNTIIKRKELFEIFKEYPHMQKPINATVDVYRRHLTVLGYLSTTGSGVLQEKLRGKYRVIKHIPTDLPSNTAYKTKK